MTERNNTATDSSRSRISYLRGQLVGGPKLHPGN